MTGKAAKGSAADGEAARLSATLALDEPVRGIAGVSDARAKALSAMGIATVRDLVTHFPRRYVDMSRVTTVAQAPPNGPCTVVAQVYEVKLKRPRPRMNITEITLNDGTDTMIVSCFHQPWLSSQLKRGDRLAVSGTMEFSYGFKRMTNPFIEKLDGAGDVPRCLIVPVHPATAKVSTAWMRRLVQGALRACEGCDDPLPPALRARRRLMSRQAALSCIHFPHAMAEAGQARRRLAYEELLMLELHLMERSVFGDEHSRYTAHVVDGPHVRALEKALPFALTADQKRAKDELLAAMAADHRANHMLLGDVGTGKTAVASFGLAAVADTGTQALMMAPTEVLAQQYAAKTGPVLDAAGVRWGLLTGSTEPAERSRVLARLSEGALDVLFGTHALLDDDVRPKACSLVVIDEQQRFGVGQRDALERKGAQADRLSMTATPIPRSLALALYGDMTLSYLRTRPAGHAGTETRVFDRTRRGEAFDIAREELERGHQVYVVCPLVGPSQAEGKKATKRPAKKQARASEGADDDYAYAQIAIEDVADMESLAPDEQRASAQAEAARLRQAFPNARVGLLHGRMSAEEKRRAMDDFRDHKTDVLVSTTVVEVGVDVPNATVMIVEEADRFGLAQLHQLRGRVGRGTAKGHVCLVSGSKAPAAVSRLRAMERTDDGFELAAYDLSLRREGDILGNRQHGASTLKLVNVVRDKEVIEQAHADARRLLASDPHLDQEGHRALRREVRLRFPVAQEAAAKAKRGDAR